MSKAQELLHLREENGLEYIHREFELIEGAESVESYYENILTDDEIEQALNMYEGTLNGISEEFCKKTQLKGYDIGFLMFATMLQCVRIYILNPIIEKKTVIERANSHGGKEDSLHSFQDKIFSKFHLEKNTLQGDMHT